jgi:hypothetical protein
MTSSRANMTMPLNLPPQTSLFFEREVICQSLILQHWPNRSNPIDRWHILQNVAALRSMRMAKQAYDQGLVQTIHRSVIRHRTGGRTKRDQLKLI